MSTVVLGSAIDIVEHCGVPRFLFTDFPLGNPCGRPYDPDMQRSIIATGIDMLERATAPGTVLRTPFCWGEDESWRAQYMRVGARNAERLAAMGAARRQSRARRSQEVRG